MLRRPEETNWLSPPEQQSWFDNFKTPNDVGIKFHEFQEFLKATIYAYLANNFNGAQDVKFTSQQEMQLFRVFDTKNDHVIDLDEFSNLCKDWLHKTFHRSCALVVVDVQNDFIEGSLALINGPANQDGADVVPVINRLLQDCQFQAVVYTQDWHPIDHIGFHENLHLRKYRLKPQPDATGIQKEADKKQSPFKLKKLNTKVNLYDTVLFDEGKMEQKLWPVHCIQNSWGAELHPKLFVAPNSIRILKGTLPNVDAYSAFWDNMRLNETALRQELSSRKIDDVFFCGLALDYCVAASALDSQKAGFNTFLIEDACRGIDEAEMERRKGEMMERGILIVNSNWVSNYTSQVCKEVKKNALAGEVQNDYINNNENNSNNNDGNGRNDRKMLLTMYYNRALRLNVV